MANGIELVLSSHNPLN